MTITLKNKNTGVIKQVKAGFSWTTFLFGLLVPLCRFDWKYFFIMFGVNVVLYLVYPPVMIGFNIGMAFAYNNLYIKDLINSGYVPADDHSAEQLKMKNLYVDNKA